MRKILLINKLAPEGVRGLLVFDLYIQYSGLDITNLRADVVGWKWVRGFGGLTCDFWAEDGKRKIIGFAKAIE
jgi:hypothetical protein